MEKKMETLGPFKGIYRAMLGLYWGVYRDNGKENGNYYNGLHGLYMIQIPTPIPILADVKLRACCHNVDI